MPITHVFYREASRSFAASLHRYVEALRGRLAYLLLLLVLSISFHSIAQTVQSYAVNIPGDLVTAGTHTFPLWSAAKMTLDNHDVVRNTGDVSKVIVIGFVGGFVRSDDQKHPEVHFAEFLRDHYRSDIYAEVFWKSSRQKSSS